MDPALNIQGMDTTLQQPAQQASPNPTVPPQAPQQVSPQTQTPTPQRTGGEGATLNTSPEVLTPSVKQQPSMMQDFMENLNPANIPQAQAQSAPTPQPTNYPGQDPKFMQYWKIAQDQHAAPDVVYNAFINGNPDNKAVQMAKLAYNTYDGTPYQKAQASMNFMAYGDVNGDGSQQQGPTGIADHMTNDPSFMQRLGSATTSALGDFGSSLGQAAGNIVQAGTDIPTELYQLAHVGASALVHGTSSPEFSNNVSALQQTASRMVGNLPTYAATLLANPELGPAAQAAIQAGATVVKHGTQMVGGEEQVTPMNVVKDAGETALNATMGYAGAKLLGNERSANPSEIQDMISAKETPGEALQSGRLTSMKGAAHSTETNAIADTVHEVYGGSVPNDPVELGTDLVNNKIPQVAQQLRQTITDNNAPVNQPALTQSIQDALDQWASKRGNEAQAQSAVKGIMGYVNNSIQENADGTLQGAWDAKIDVANQLKKEFGDSIFASPTDAPDTARRGAVRAMNQAFGEFIDQNLTRAMNDRASAAAEAASTAGGDEVSLGALSPNDTGIAEASRASQLDKSMSVDQANAQAEAEAAAKKGAFKQGMSTLHNLYTAVGNIADKLPKKFEPTTSSMIKSGIMKTAKGVAIAGAGYAVGSEFLNKANELHANFTSPPGE